MTASSFRTLSIVGLLTMAFAPAAFSSTFLSVTNIHPYDPATYFAGGVTAGLDFNSGASPTQSGFLGVPGSNNKTYNLTHNGITFDITVINANQGNQNRDRSATNGDGQTGDLTRDFEQWYGRNAAGGAVEAHIKVGGLLPNSFYDLEFFMMNIGAGQTRHLFYNGTSSTDDLIVDFTTAGGPNSAANRALWRPGVRIQYATDSSGVIDVTILAPTFDASGNTDSRLTFDGMSVTYIGPAPVDEFTLTITPTTPPATGFDFTWPSQPDKVYDLLTSTDLADPIAVWPIYDDGETLYEAIPSAGETTTLTAVPSADPRRFFAIHEYDAPPPPPPPVESELSSVWGNGTTVTLNFTEALDEATATDVQNYDVFSEDVFWVVTSAMLSPDGKTVTLTLETPLPIDTTFTVSLNNLTSSDGTPLAGSTSAQFQTWDNDPDGIKVFILAGQSNMVGFGHVETGHDDVAGAIGSLRHLAVNNASFPEYDYTSLLVDPTEPETSPWRTRQDVQVWWRDGGANLGGIVRKGATGPPFYGTSRNPVPNLYGPEFGFGHVIGDFYADDDVLIIKAAWGGRSLAVDFRPPSRPLNRPPIPLEEPEENIGRFYRAIFDYSRDVLENLGTEFPQWEGRGYQIAGFGWHQGWNDRVTQAYNDEYEANMKSFIDDVRAEFGQPALPFVIATTGIGGWDESHPRALSLMNAQLAMADFDEYPEHEGNVDVIDTRDFWREADVSPAGPNQGFHWHQNGETFFLIGKSMGDRMVDLLEP